MAKVMVSLPDDLLSALDAEALRRGTTRSGLLRELAEATIQRRSQRRAERIADLHRRSRVHGYGGDVAALVKANRPTR